MDLSWYWFERPTVGWILFKKSKVMPEWGSNHLHAVWMLYLVIRCIKHKFFSCLQLFIVTDYCVLICVVCDVVFLFVSCNEILFKLENNK